MKTLKTRKTSLFLLLGAMLSGCGYDNFEEPTSQLTGRVVYDGSPVGVRTNGTRLELWEDGHALRTPMNVHIAHNGTFSATLFDGTYKIVRKGDAPWLPQTADTIVVTVRGNTTVEVPVRPYFVVRNESFQKNGTSVVARFTVDRVENPASLDAVRLYIGRSLLTDQNRAEARFDVALSDIVYGQEATITGELPDGLKAIDRVFVRLGVKSDQSGEYYYTQAQRLDLK